MTAQAAMQNGELDAFMEASYRFCQDMEKAGFPRQTTQTWYFSNFLVFASGVEGSPLEDVRVRKAICYSINSEEICQSIDLGMAFVNPGYGISGTPFGGEAIQGYGYDVDKAKALLAEAGYGDGFQTKIYTGTDLQNKPLMVAIQGYLAEIGIQAELIYQDVSVWASQTIYGIDDGMILCAHGFGSNIVNQGVSNFSKQAVDGVGMLKESKIHPDDVDEALMKALQAEEMFLEFQIADQLITDEYCLAYPVDSDSYSWTSLRDTFQDNGCFATRTEYYDYSLLTVR